MDDTILIKLLQDSIQSLEMAVKKGKGIYALKEYRDKIEFHQGAVWAVNVILKDVKKHMEPAPPRPTKGCFAPQKGSHYTGD